MYNFFQKILRFLEGITNSWFSIGVMFAFSSLVSYLAYKFNIGLPKPETIVEFGKFYFSDPVPYFKGTFFNAIAAFLWISLGAALIYRAINNREEFPDWLNILFILFGIGFIVCSVYFFRYFILLVVTLLLIGAIAAFAMSGSSNTNKRYR